MPEAAKKTAAAPKKATRKQLEEAFAEAMKDDRCPLGKILHESSKEVAEVIQEKVDDDLNYPGAMISRVLKATGFPVVSSEIINKHRKNLCRCKD